MSLPPIIETPVLILGAGPVGMGLALDLAWRGRKCVIVEKAAAGPVLHPRAGGVAARTMEFCRRWGIADDVKRAGFPRDRQMDVVFCTGLHGHLLSRQPIAPLGNRDDLPFSPEHRERCPQIWFDPILARAIDARPDYIKPMYGHTLLDFEQDERQVRARVRDDRSGEIVTIAASFFVGCDGNESGVRSALGIEVEGEQVLSYSVNAIVRAPRLNELNRQGEGVRYLFVGPSGTWANMTAIDGRELWRFTLIGNESRMDLESLDMAAHIRRAWGDIPFEVLTTAPWRRKEVNAVHYREGRVFLAGDAAHTMSPTGGAGMNTGMGDAADLGWKLDAVLRGWGGEGLLESYEFERRSVGLRNARWSSGNFKAWKSSASWPELLDDTPAGERCRRDIGQGFLSSLRDEWASWGIQLGYRYEGSPIIVPDGSPETSDTAGDYVQTARPGSRAPHAWLSPGRSTIDLFGDGFVLLDFGAQPEAASELLRAADALGVPMRRERIVDAKITALYGATLVLVRPDGHVAWRGDKPPASPDLLVRIVAGLASAGAQRAVQPGVHRVAT
jgi:2-polyprenyl-6-methoxyphenol hydroxylase-like FAD-dependent oxidoreductase